MAAVDLATRDDLVLLLEEIRQVRTELAALRADQEAEAIPVGEAAQRLGVSTRTISRMIARGELTCVKVGAARRVRVAGLLNARPPEE